MIVRGMRGDQVMESPDDVAAAYRAELRRLLDAVDRIPPDLLSEPIHGDWTIKGSAAPDSTLATIGSMRRTARHCPRFVCLHPSSLEPRAVAGGYQII